MRISGEDSQPVSALLIASAIAEGSTELIVRNPGEKGNNNFVTGSSNIMDFTIGPATSKDLGLEEKVSWPSLFAFCATILIARWIDAVGRKIKPGFSITRLITRALGYQFMSKLLMDQTKPLKLPNHLLTSVNMMMADWGKDKGRRGGAGWGGSGAGEL